MAPTGTFTASGFGDGGLYGWLPSPTYYSYDGTVDVLRDPNGNIQFAATGGTAGTTEPTWNLTPGGLTYDGDAVWLNLGPLDCALLSSEITLTWTSTGATSASISGVGSVAVNGSMQVTVTTDCLVYLGGAWRTQWCQGQFILTLTGPGGTTTYAVQFYVRYTFERWVVYSFAPVNLAEPGDPYSFVTALAPNQYPAPRWQADTEYIEGQTVLDSNTDAEVALNSGTSAGIEPTWMGVDDVTTETTGLRWQNLGGVYAGIVAEGACGPEKAGAIGGSPVLGFSFGDAVIPDNATVPASWQPNHSYSPGDKINDLDGNYSGIGVAICIQAGISGTEIPGPFGSSAVNGSVVPEALWGHGGTAVWQMVGLMAASLNWAGVLNTTARYCHAMHLDIINWSSGQSLTPGSVNSTGTLTAGNLAAFLTDPSGRDFSISPYSTEDIDECNPEDLCCVGAGIQWVASANYACGYWQATIAGAWIALEMPFQPEFPGTMPTCDLHVSYPVTGAALLTWTSENANSAYLTPFGGVPIPVAVNGSLLVHPTVATRYDLSVTGPAGQTTCSLWVPAAPGARIAIRLLPGLKIPTGQGHSVNELDGESSIAGLEIVSIDPSNELKYLLTKPELVGKTAVLKMGFEGMNLSDFVPLHTVQVSDVGRTEEGWIRFSNRDNLALLDRALWFCGGPQPVALPWLYGQAYTKGQFVQDSNGNIERCLTAGVSDETQPPVWPGTIVPGWEPNTLYTLGTWLTDGNGNLLELTTVPSGSTSTKPLNMGRSGTTAPTWSTALSGTTVDNHGGSADGPITWTLIAINQLGQQVTDGTVTWELIAKPYQGAYGGAQAFYVYSIYGQTVQVPEPPKRTAFTSNQYPTIEGNPRYIYGNPIDVMLVALQNELGIGQDPLLPPIVTTDPNDPQNALVFAPNPDWQQYVPGDDTTLINPNPFLALDNILAVRNYQAAGRKMEWIVKRPVTAKQWIQNEILKPLGLYMFTHNDGTLDLKAMGSPPSDTTPLIDQNTIQDTPDQLRLPIVNVNTIRGDVDDEGAYSAARVYDGEMTFPQQRSLEVYLQQFAQSAESNGLREPYDSFGMGYLLSDRIFRRHAFGTPEYTVKVALSQIRHEIGDFVLLTHPLMLDYASKSGRLGISKVLCEITDRQPDYANATITLKLWDMRFMNIPESFEVAPLAEEIPDWSSATTAQKAKYMFISSWPGYYSDGTPGNVIGTDASGPAIVVTPGIPTAPSSLQAVAGNTEAFLSWDESSGATSYNVKRSTTSGSGYATVASSSDPFLTNTGLSNGTTYYYVVSAVNDAGESNDSSQIACLPEA
jgi:hypothetical protein